MSTDYQVLVLPLYQYEEGQNWEAALAISNSRIKNVVAVVDCNGFSQDNYSALSIDQIGRMFVAAGWDTMSLYRQHDFVDLQNTIGMAVLKQYPVAILKETIKGQAILEKSRRSRI